MKLLLRSMPLLLVAACGAPRSAPAPGAPEPGSPAPQTPTGQVTPKTAPAAPPPPVGASGPGDGGAPRATSPVADAAGGDGSTSAGPATTRRLEDLKTDKTTATGGSYLVAVRSAAGLVPDEVGKAVNAAASKTDACYAKALKKKPPLGAILYELTIDAKGGASAVKLVSDAIKDPELTRCLETSLKAIAWPKPTEKAGGKTTIEFATTK